MLLSDPRKQHAQKLWKQIRDDQYKELRNQNYRGFEDLNTTANKGDLSRSKVDDPTPQADFENQANDSTVQDGSNAGEQNRSPSRESSGESNRPAPFLGWGNILQRQDLHKQGFRVADREKQVQRAAHLVDKMKSEMGKMPVERNKGGLEIRA